MAGTTNAADKKFMLYQEMISDITKRLISGESIRSIKCTHIRATSQLINRLKHELEKKAKKQKAEESKYVYQRPLLFDSFKHPLEFTWPKSRDYFTRYSCYIDLPDDSAIFDPLFDNYEHWELGRLRQKYF